jgi:hypothetical protein
MYRVPAIAVLLAAAALPPSLAGQMRAVQRPNIPGRIRVGPQFRPAQPPAGGFRMVMQRPPSRRGVFVSTGVFPNHFRFSVFFGDSCFTDPFFDPFFCRQFFFRNRFFFAQPVFLPYPVYTAPYSQVVEQTPSTVADRGSDLARELQRGWHVLLSADGRRGGGVSRACSRAACSSRSRSTSSVSRFWCFVMVIGARSGTTRLSARHSGYSPSSGHGRYLSPISMWKPQSK